MFLLALARLKERYGRASLPPRPEARLKKDTRLVSKAFVAAGLVARVPDRELDSAYIGDLDYL